VCVCVQIYFGVWVRVYVGVWVHVCVGNGLDRSEWLQCCLWLIIACTHWSHSYSSNNGEVPICKEAKETPIVQTLFLVSSRNKQPN